VEFNKVSLTSKKDCLLDLHNELSLLTQNVRLLGKAELNNIILKALLENNLIYEMFAC